jgi:BirA family transcriptional regulator, biotin operon repressor / biotin---[acetyl-CoA-carboxylase] ligase
MPFLELSTIDSTNNYALSQLHAGLAQHGSTFFAHEQVSGKGQRGKSWTTEKDTALILSIVINPHPLKLRQQFQLSACVAVSVYEFFSKYAGDASRIKWPNDLYWHDRKAGGILIENIIGGDGSIQNDDKSSHLSAKWLWAVAGIGININQTIFPEDLRNAISIRQITGKSFDPIELAKELCEVVDKNFKNLITNGFENIYASYLSYLYKINETVKLKKGTRIFEGIVKSVSPGGELVVQHAIEEEFGFGEIEWVIPGARSEK